MDNKQLLEIGELYKPRVENLTTMNSNKKVFYVPKNYILLCLKSEIEDHYLKITFLYKKEIVVCYIPEKTYIPYIERVIL